MYIENVIKSTVRRRCCIEAPTDLVKAVNDIVYNHFAKGFLMTGPSSVEEKIYESSGNEVVANTDWSSILELYKAEGAKKAADKVLKDRHDAYHKSNEYKLYRKYKEAEMRVDYAISLIVGDCEGLDDYVTNNYADCDRAKRVIEIVVEKAEKMSNEEIESYDWQKAIEIGLKSKRIAKMIESEDEEDDCDDGRSNGDCA